VKAIQVKRNIANLLSALTLIVGWVLIYLGTQYESEMQDWFLVNTGNGFIGEWSATLIMTIVNYVIPWILSHIAELENWDF
jgi:hypothetical protein